MCCTAAFRSIISTGTSLRRKWLVAEAGETPLRSRPVHPSTATASPGTEIWNLMTLLDPESSIQSLNARCSLLCSTICTFSFPLETVIELELASGHFWCIKYAAKLADINAIYIWQTCWRRACMHAESHPALAWSACHICMQSTYIYVDDHHNRENLPAAAIAKILSMPPLQRQLSRCSTLVRARTPAHCLPAFKLRFTCSTSRFELYVRQTWDTLEYQVRLNKCYLGFHTTSSSTRARDFHTFVCHLA